MTVLREPIRHKGGLPAAVGSEWVKLRSVRSTWWCLAATVIVVVAYVAMVGLSASASYANGEVVPPMTPGDVAGMGVFLLGQLALATLACMAIAGEYATGSIASTLQWVPRRARLLLAKALLVAPVLFAGGVAATLAGSLVGIYVLDGAAAPWSWPDLLGDVAAIGFYSAVVGFVALGMGAMLPSVAGSIGCCFLVLLMLPMSLASSGVEALQRIGGWFPGSAGMALVGGDGPTYGVTGALAVLLAWAAGMLAGGMAVFRRRDARST
ncbi:MAG TPA: ABC transporter permease [Actinomycetota bacterium]|nr:ABC transporter permease [Actinomycetota bacterium]